MATLESLAGLDSSKNESKTLEQLLNDCNLDTIDPNKPILLDGVEIMPIRMVTPLTTIEKLNAIDSVNRVCTEYHSRCVARTSRSATRIRTNGWKFTPDVTLVIRFGLKDDPGRVEFPCPSGRMSWNHPCFEVGHAIQVRDWWLFMCRMTKPILCPWTICGYVINSANPAESHFHLFKPIMGAKPEYAPFQFDNLFITDVTLMMVKFYPAEMATVIKKNPDAPASWEVIKL